ncbi:MAG TPA: DNA primase [Bacillota bacterium]|nr:DNA primase [Bacillota bacterium]
MPYKIPEDIIEKIRKSNDIVEVVGEYVQLKKQGRNFFGLCPFHGEKTPSFSVTPEKQIFHCFGCGKGGNVITFLMEMEEYSFYEALVSLANRANVEIPEAIAQKRSSYSGKFADILSAHEWLTKLYHHLLKHTKDGKEGYQYIKERGIRDETIDTFQLGFAPNVKDFTLEFLTKKGFHKQDLVKAGLLSIQEDNSVSDRFRGRVIFPIRNHLGKTIAFAGRSMTDRDPKYLNSPENELFRKGKMLYNFDLAKRHIRQQNEAVLFEGYMDVISAWQAGVKNGIATMGTSLTAFQAKLLRRYVDTVILCYDADRSGQDATYNAAKLLRQAGCRVKVANLKDNLDPDSFIASYGAEAFKRDVIDASMTFIHFYMQYIKKDYNLSIQDDRLQFINNVVEQIALIDNPIEREHYLNELANEYNIRIEALVEQIESIRQKLGIHRDKREQNRYTNRAANFKVETKLRPAFHNAERELIAYMMQNSTIADKVQEEIGAAFNIDEHKIIVTYLYAYYEEDRPADVSAFIEWISEEHIRKLVTDIAMIPIFKDISQKQINDYIKTIKSHSNERTRIQSLKKQQKIAEQKNDPIKAAQIAMQIIDMQKQLNSSS